PAAFDPEKLTWMNGEYVRAMEADRFDELIRPWIEKGLERPLTEEEWGRFAIVSPLVQERTHLLPEAADQVRFLFEDFESYESVSWSKVMAKDGVAEVLDGVADRLGALENWDAEAIEAA